MWRAIEATEVRCEDWLASGAGGTEKLLGVLEELDDLGEREGGCCPIDDAVVAGEGERHELADEHAAVAHDHAFTRATDGEDADFGIVDDGCGEAARV